ncbi:hypothetical protein ACWGVR_06630 [Streptomyces xanthophaeus]
MKMKLGKVIAAAVLLTPLSFAGLTDPAAAAAAHIVTADVFVSARDGFDRNSIKRKANFTLTHNKRTTSVKYRACTDGATAVLKLHVTLNGDETVTVSPNLALYDASAWCEMKDLAGSKSPEPATLGGGGGRLILDFTVTSDKFLGKDDASAGMTVTHNLWP